jgi:hypothetical protein
MHATPIGITTMNVHDAMEQHILTICIMMAFNSLLSASLKKSVTSANITNTSF